MRRCKSCKEPAAPGRSKCEKHLAYHREYQRRWTEMNREKVNAQRRSNYLDDRQNRIAGERMRRWGLTREDFLDMLEAQNGVCAICFKPETSLGNHGRVKNMSVDHDHDTGRIRGLLCNNCNRAIGLLGDSVETLQSAIDYLSRSRVDGTLA